MSPTSRAPRSPARDTYDAAVGLAPWDGVPSFAFAVVKTTWSFERAPHELCAPIPLAHDLREREVRQARPVGSDFHPFKRATDLVVLGHGYAPRDGAASREVSIAVGAVTKRLQVFGARVLRRKGRSGPRVEYLEPLGAVPLTREEAYGGAPGATRCPDVRPQVEHHLGLMRAGERGIYPRNPYGKGYWSLDEDPEEVLLPRVEDPADLLTLERLLAQPSAPWTAMPLPWHLDWTSYDQFPRMPLLQRLPEGVAPETLAESARGLVPASWLDPAGVEPYLRDLGPLHEASLGMSVSELAPGTPVRLIGMHPEHDVLELRVPAPPAIVIEVEGSREAVAPRLLNLVVSPDERRFTTTWAAVRTELPRKLVPGVHGHIPLSVHVDRDAPIAYPTPPTVYAAVRAARAAPPAERVSAGEVELWPGLLGADAPARDRDLATATERLGDVDVPTGRLLLDETDWVLERVDFPFAWTRHYASSRAWRAGALGPGWSHPLEQAVWIEQGTLFYRATDGRELAVARLRAAELGLGRVAHHPREGVTIRQTGTDAFEVGSRDGWRASLAVIARAVEAGPREARPTRWISPLGEVAEVGYDVHGRLARLVLPSGSELRFEHDARGRLSRLLVPTSDGSQHAVGARYAHDGAGLLTGAWDGAERPTRYRYTSRVLVQRTAPGGETIRYRYDEPGARGRVVAIERVVDRATREILFDPSRRVAVAIDALGHARARELDPGWRVLVARDAHGHEARREYDEATGLCVAAIDRLGGRTDLLYDASGHLAEQAGPGGTIVLDHDALGRCVRRVDATGHEERTAWDSDGRLVARVEADGSSALYEHDEAGRLVTVVPPTEQRVALGRDARGQVGSVESALGVRRIVRDALGRPREVLDEEGHSITLRCDPTGRLRGVAWGTGVRVLIERGPSGEPARWTDDALDVALERDPGGRLSAVQAGGEELVTLHRDPEGRITMVESPSLALHELRYDGRGQLVEESAFDDTLTRRTYDPEERLVRIERPGRVVSRYERDAAGRLIRALHGDAFEERFEHDAAGRSIGAFSSAASVRFERDGRGRARRESHELGGRSFELASRYDPSGRRVELESSAGLRVRVARDSRGAPTELRLEGQGEPLRVGFVLCPRGLERERRLPGSIAQRLDRDAAGRVTRRRILAPDGRVLSETEYSWAGLERLVGTLDTHGGRTSMQHDARGFLVSVRPGLVCPRDEDGNLYRVPSRDDHRYDAMGRLLEAYGVTYRYDEAGRRIEKEAADGSITRYRWEGPSRLVEVELPDARRVRYAYDALGRWVGRRLERREGDGWALVRERHYVWDGLTLLHEVEGEATTSWIWLDGELVGTLQGGRRHAVLTDPIGVVSQVVGEDGSLSWRGGVDCFGAGWRELEQVRQPWRFPGHLEDEDTGLAMSLWRAFDPEAAQYLSPCPLGIAAGIRPYAYVRDPLSETSPLGLGPGLDPYYGPELPACGEALHVALALDALDRRDGAAGPRARFEPRALLPDPLDLEWGAWSRHHPARALDR